MGLMMFDKDISSMPLITHRLPRKFPYPQLVSHPAWHGPSENRIPAGRILEGSLKDAFKLQ